MKNLIVFLAVICLFNLVSCETPENEEETKYRLYNVDKNDIDPPGPKSINVYELKNNETLAYKKGTGQQRK